MYYGAAVSRSQDRPAAVRLHRRIGAVAIYSVPLAAAITALVLAVLVGAGYAIGRLTTSGSSSTTTVVKRVAVPAPPTAAEAGRQAADMRRAEATAWRSGYRRGLRRGAERAAVATPSVDALVAGTPYVVVRASGSSALTFKVPVEAGRLYRLCPDRAGICVRPGS